jgi:hypothetical protein
MHLQATAAVAADTAVAARITEAIARLDQMIAELRRHVFALVRTRSEPVLPRNRHGALRFGVAHPRCAAGHPLGRDRAR